jgi:cell division protein FtsN
MRTSRTTRTRPRKREEGNFLAGMGVGVLVGLAVSLSIAFYLNRTPLPFMSGAKPKHAEKNGAAPKPPAIAGLPSGAPPAPATGAEKPKFDFYRILPGSEEPVTEKEIRERLRAKSGQQDAAKDVYFIQAGSFQNPADADNQKARLAILDKGTWYRVRMGPYAKLDEINKVRQALAQNGIDASLIKVKDQQ